jgi:RNA polymerase sigma factor (sigma-70 family)
VTEPIAADRDLRRDLAPQVLVRLLRQHGSDQFGRCEDAVQEALLAAHRQWPQAMPQDPHAWLVTTARRRYVDAVRSDSRRRDRERRFIELEGRPAEAIAPSQDDTLRLIELCCHPALPRTGRIALTLRAVGGLSTSQIAHAYALPEATIAQRIVRAKRRLREAGATFPPAVDTRERLPAVLAVLYLMFTEAHHTTAGNPATDTELAVEAIRLMRLVVAAVADDTEATGLLALMLLTQARQPGRISESGELIPLDEQDRALWNPVLIEEGLDLLTHAVPGAVPGPYLLQGCIAGLHAQAESTEATDWHEIRAIYRLLQQQSPANASIAVNAAVAQAMVAGPEAGLAALAALSPQPSRAHGVAAHLFERIGDAHSAARAYRQAIKHTTSTAERNYLHRRLAALSGGTNTSEGPVNKEIPR